MPKHAEQKILPYSAEQLFDLVADVRSYPEFLPWCLHADVKSNENNVMMADLVIGYKVVQERFGSKVTLKRPGAIEVQYVSGPMKYLVNHWKFVDQSDGSCLVDFYVDFEFKNIVLQKLMQVFFHKAVQKMVSAFEARAKVLYD